MNLAARDIQHSVGRFLLTAFGIRLLLMLSSRNGRIYQGCCFEATQLVRRSARTCGWCKGTTRGPFAEVSTAAGEFGVSAAGRAGGARGARVRFAHHPTRASRETVRVFVQGWIGRRTAASGCRWSLAALEQCPLQMIADEALGLDLGDPHTFGEGQLHCGRSHPGDHVVRGRWHRVLYRAGRLAIQFDAPGEAHAGWSARARRGRAASADTGRSHLNSWSGIRAVNGIARFGAAAGQRDSVKTMPGANLASVVSTVAAWPM